MNTADQYLKVIYLIQEIEDGPAATGTVADRLGVSPASANEMIGKLQTRGFADHETYRGTTLTDEGRVRARDAIRTYCVIEHFLADVLAVETFREEAHGLESAIDETVADRLDTIVDRNSACPDCFDPGDDKCRLLEPPGPADD